MRILPGEFIHGSGFKNTGSTGNYRMQLLIMDEGIKRCGVIKYNNENLSFQNVSVEELARYKFEENDDDNNNNRNVINYAYTSNKNLDICNVKTHTGVDLKLSNDSKSSANLILPSQFNNLKLKPNLLHGVKNCDEQVNNNVAWNLRKNKTCQQWFLAKRARSSKKQTA